MLMRLPSAVLVVINILKGITRNKLEDNDSGGDISAIISDLNVSKEKIFAFSVFFVIVTPPRRWPSSYLLLEPPTAGDHTAAVIEMSGLLLVAGSA